MGGARTLWLISACLLLLRPTQWSISAASGKPTCRKEERSALLRFKNSFHNESRCLYFGSPLGKMTSWKAEEGKSGNCCDWEGVTCNEEDGHVFGLDLSGSCLDGRIDSEASFFDLVHLQELNLANNRFEGSRIPRSFGNMTSLRSLVLSYCGLSGEFPDSIFALPRLEFLDVGGNNGLTGRLTGFHQGSPIKSLKLSGMNFTGELPVLLGNLSYLTEIDLSSCGFSGEIPSSIGDLTNLESLDLSENKFHGPIPSSFGNLTNLTVLYLSNNRLRGEIPWSLENLIRLYTLDFGKNQLTGGIPSVLGNLFKLLYLSLSSNQLEGGIPTPLMQLSQLSSLDLSSNMLTGNVPSRISNLTNLQYLDLRSNYLTGTPHLDLLLELTEIDLSFNAFSSIIFPEGNNTSSSQIKILRLDSCNLTEVPQFLKHQLKLILLSMSHNNISGQIPTWLLERTWYLDLSFNYIQGKFRTPLNSVYFYLISNNRLSGEIPSSICKLENILTLDLADNDFTGVLPPCFGNFSSILRALSLSGNNFSGRIPEFNHKQCVLSTIDLSTNSFEGPFPRSLTNCSSLMYANFGRNKITDTFPSWLGSLPSLRVLMLHSNRFHGGMKVSQNNSWFPSLKVIKLSDNNMGGRLQADYFIHWQAMKYFSLDDEIYPDSFLQMITMTIMDKGIEREFGKTLGSFTLLDLLSNNFSGTIPESIGDNLLKLRTLNLSNNDLSGPIPLSLANLENLEVLDLSRNRLSGEIPRILTRITYLNHFNVSYNNLSGSIPGENQFGTFENTSYIGNPELCGSPLSKKCGNPPQSLPSPGDSKEVKSSQPLGMVWITTLVGLAGGLVIGVALELAFGADVQYWVARKWRKYRSRQFK